MPESQPLGRSEPLKTGSLADQGQTRAAPGPPGSTAPALTKLPHWEDSNQRNSYYIIKNATIYAKTEKMQ